MLQQSLFFAASEQATSLWCIYLPLPLKVFHLTLPSMNIFNLFEKLSFKYEFYV